MSWVSNYEYKWYEMLAMNVVSSGAVPKHIAFIMDGNRRYARSERISKISGHAKGFEKLAECLRWCLDVGVKEVTTFAFSIENFKRSKDEVEGLLNLATEKFSILLSEEDNLREHGVRVRVIGNISLLPLELQKLISTAIVRTESNDKLFLNIAFSYTSHDEITQAVESILYYGKQLLDVDDINENILGNCTYTRQSLTPDLLFRSSGENRISDFLMWQLSETVLYFTRMLWPQITFWNFLGAIFVYQKAVRHLNRIESKHTKDIKNDWLTNRVRHFFHKLDACRKRLLIQLVNLE